MGVRPGSRHRLGSLEAPGHKDRNLWGIVANLEGATRIEISGTLIRANPEGVTRIDISGALILANLEGVIRTCFNL